MNDFMKGPQISRAPVDPSNVTGGTVTNQMTSSANAARNTVEWLSLGARFDTWCLANSAYEGMDVIKKNVRIEGGKLVIGIVILENWFASEYGNNDCVFAGKEGEEVRFNEILAVIVSLGWERPEDIRKTLQMTGREVVAFLSEFTNLKLGEYSFDNVLGGTYTFIVTQGGIVGEWKENTEV